MHPPRAVVVAALRIRLAWLVATRLSVVALLIHFA
jgi:hypothetical protein